MKQYMKQLIPSFKNIMEFPSNFEKQLAGGETSVTTASPKLNF